MKKLYLAMGLALVGMLVAAGAVFAAVTFDPSNGTGFVGKGDVQTALGLNNAQVQSANIQFRALKVTESTWTCDRDAGPQTQEKARSTTTRAVLSSIARVKNQITGYNLNGYDTSQPETEIDHSGPPLNDCPTGWTAINKSSTVVSSTLQVSNGGANWVNLT